MAQRSSGLPKRLNALLAMAVLVLWSAGAATAQPRQAGAHNHGHASLTLALEGRTLSVTFESPAFPLYGFERAARTPAENAAIASVRGRLASADTLFRLEPAGGCQLSQSDLSGLSPGARAQQDGHADVSALYTFVCAAGKTPGRIEVTAFDQFSGLERVDILLIGPKGQKAGAARPQRRSVDLR